MSANSRIEGAVGSAQVTQKMMGNGELVSRMIVEGLGRVSLTKASNWNWSKSLPWQNEHYHKGLIENYTILLGWMIVVYRRKGKIQKSFLSNKRGDKHFIRFEVSEPHCILLSSDAVLSVSTFGMGIKNPEKKNNDWWESNIFDDFIQTFTSDECKSFVESHMFLQ